MTGRISEFLANSSDIYFYIALASTLFFVIQFVMALFGGVGGHDMSDGDLNTDAADLDATDYHAISDVNFFSVKSITAFLMFFGWAGFFWGDRGWLGLAIAFCCGLVMMITTSLVIFLMLKMQQSGNISPAEMVGGKGRVYLGVPGKRAGTGKVTVNLPQCTREINAMADEDIERGALVKVLLHLEGNCYLVEKIK
jgi:magnesium-transporting ATPase (P-type)